MKTHAWQNILRGVLVLIALGFLLVGMSFLWNPLSPWIASYFIGSMLMSFSISLFWIAAFRAYRALVGAGVGAFVSFGAIGIYLLQNNIFEGEYCLYVALLSLWLFFLGMKWPLRKADYLPLSVQCLFGIMLTFLLIEGVHLVVPASSYFLSILQPGVPVLYGWILIGAALFFGLSLMTPTWEVGYPLLYGLLVFDLLIVGPYTSLFVEEAQNIHMPFFLWASLIVIIVSAIWALIELGRRLFSVRKNLS